jgi:adenine deaminase
MKELLAVARGDRPADFVIKGARVANVYTLEYEEVDVAVLGNKIAGIGKNYEGERVVNGTGKVLIPGMIDGHIHIESTMLTPSYFADQAIAHGTTAVMADPHEIANVLGMRGVEYMYRASQGLWLDIFLGAPSCVPASNFETPFENLEMDHIREMFRRGWCQHLGEVMNFPGVIRGDDGVWGKIEAAGDVPLTGHAPGIRGRALCAYMSGGISSDHECTNPEEALEKLRRGMWLMIREGTFARDLKRLLSLVKERPDLSSRCMVVSDDITAEELVRGHMDGKMRLMAEEGLDPLMALRMVTLSPAAYFGLKDRGAIGPGLLADMALVENLESCEIDKVWKGGLLVVDDGKLCRANSVGFDFAAFCAEYTTTSISLPRLKIPAPEMADMAVIGVEDGTIVTRTILMTPSVSEGLAVADAERDIAKIVVQERHRGTGRFAVGFVSGLGMTQGAIASSVAHDAHNFVAVGMDDLSIVTAISHLEKNEGGLVATTQSEVRGYLALPVGGLMAMVNAATLSRSLQELEKKVSELGFKISNPFMVLSFLCLSVVPELKITDKGYIDIVHGSIIPLFSYFDPR